MPEKQKYLVTMTPVGTNLGDVEFEVTATDPVKALEEARRVAREKHPELKSTTFSYSEIKLSD